MNTPQNYWTIDKDNLEKLQVLKEFVDFVASLEGTGPGHKNNAPEIKYLIENLDKPETFKDWCACIDIFNETIQIGNYGKNGGIYWKSWSVWFENEMLEIAIKERSVDREGFPDEDLIFYKVIAFAKDFEGDRIIGDTNDLDFLGFLSDAHIYKNYIKDDLKDVETEIDIF